MNALLRRVVIEHRSLALDLRILWRTVQLVFGNVQERQFTRFWSEAPAAA